MSECDHNSEPKSFPVRFCCVCERNITLERHKRDRHGRRFCKPCYKNRKPVPIRHCCVCNDNISVLSRVRDPKGRYFCKRCYVMGQIRKQQLAAIAAARNQLAQSPPDTIAPPLPQTPSSSPPQLAPVGLSIVPCELLLDLPPAVPLWAPVAETPEVLITPVQPAPAAAPINPVSSIASPTPPLTRSDVTAPAALCPLCNGPLPLGHRVCIECTQEMPNLEKLLALREKHTKLILRNKRRRKIARSVAIAFVPIALASLALIAYGRWLAPPDPLDHYPTTRAEAVQEILSDIQQGTDKSYDTALDLMSTRAGKPANADADRAYKSAFAHMHDDFLQKYGADWLTKAQIENLFPDDNGPLVPFAITLKNDVYHVTAQSLTPARSPQNGKQRFGIFEITEYPILPAALRRAPLKLDDSPSANDFKAQANTQLPAGASLGQ
jgi:hypothetical protein